MSVLFIYLFTLNLFIFRERGREGEREGESHQYVRDIDQLPPRTCLQPGTRPTAQACSLTGNLTNDHYVGRPTLSPLSHTSQGYFIFIFYFIDFIGVTLVNKII